MSTYLFLFSALCLSLQLSAQMVNNGNFSTQPAHSMWNHCSNGVENSTFETIYGGIDGTNYVAEIDGEIVALCQNVGGFIIGQNYTLTFRAARRIGGCPAPNPVDADITISGGVLSVNVQVSNTSWEWTSFSYTFTATATTHLLSVFPGALNTTTCGFIIDDLQITPTTPLSAEKISLQAWKKNNYIAITTSNPPNKEVEIQRSEDMIMWETLGNHNFFNNHTFYDKKPLKKSYYRLSFKENDIWHYSNVVFVSFNDTLLRLFPNPASSYLHIDTQQSNFTLVMVNNFGIEQLVSKNEKIIDVRHLKAGLYIAKVYVNGVLELQEKIVLLRENK